MEPFLIACKIAPTSSLKYVFILQLCAKHLRNQQAEPQGVRQFIHVNLWQISYANLSPLIFRKGAGSEQFDVSQIERCRLEKNQFQKFTLVG